MRYGIDYMDEFVALEAIALEAQVAAGYKIDYQYDLQFNVMGASTAIFPDVDIDSAVLTEGTLLLDPYWVVTPIASAGAYTGSWSVLFGSMASLLPRGYYFNPIDQAVNPYHAGQWTFRQIFQTFCSTHVTVDKTTGQEMPPHVDTVNPVPGWPLLLGPGGAAAVWPTTFVLHAALDMAEFYPSSLACH